MYYIEQVEGTLKEASEGLRLAVRDGEMEVAKVIYRQHVGEPPTISRIWWMFNAPSRVARHSRLTADDWATFHGSQKSRAYQAARLAESRVGGKWRVFYEY